MNQTSAAPYSPGQRRQALPEIADQLHLAVTASTDTTAEPRAEPSGDTPSVEVVAEADPAAYPGMATPPSTAEVRDGRHAGTGIEWVPARQSHRHGPRPVVPTKPKPDEAVAGPTRWCINHDQDRGDWVATSHFYNDKARADGLMSICKDCKKAKNARYAQDRSGATTPSTRPSTTPKPNASAANGTSSATVARNPRGRIGAELPATLASISKPGDALDPEQLKVIGLRLVSWLASFTEGAERNMAERMVGYIRSEVIQAWQATQDALAAAPAWLGSAPTGNLLAWLTETSRPRFFLSGTFLVEDGGNAETPRYHLHARAGVPVAVPQMAVTAEVVVFAAQMALGAHEARPPESILGITFG